MPTPSPSKLRAPTTTHPQSSGLPPLLTLKAPGSHHHTLTLTYTAAHQLHPTHAATPTSIPYTTHHTQLSHAEREYHGELAAAHRAVERLADRVDAVRASVGARLTAYPAASCTVL
jgi:hypothetical protein